MVGNKGGKQRGNGENPSKATINATVTKDDYELKNSRRASTRIPALPGG